MNLDRQWEAHAYRVRDEIWRTVLRAIINTSRLFYKIEPNCRSPMGSMLENISHLSPRFHQGAAGFIWNGHELKSCEARRMSRSWNRRSSRLRMDERKELRGDTRGEAIDIYNHIDKKELRESYLAHIPQLGI